MQARRYFGIIDRLAIRGDILPRGRLCHVHGTAADALRCEGAKTWRNEHDLVTVVKHPNGKLRVVTSRSERLHEERGAVHPRRRGDGLAS